MTITVTVIVQATGHAHYVLYVDVANWLHVANETINQKHFNHSTIRPLAVCIFAAFAIVCHFWFAVWN